MGDARLAGEEDMSPTLDAIVIGAGPYGLAVSAELRRAGAEVRVFGETMAFWMRHMPRGMCLRSRWSASHIGDPRSSLSLDVFERERAAAGIPRPIPIADFVAYGHWFQAHALPDVDSRAVTRVEAYDGGFRVTVADGEPIEVRRIVVAAGIGPFAARPAVFDGLSPDLASHSVEHADPARFAGRRVAVIGGGQSAIESAVLLQENGAEVEVIMRARELRWVGRAPREGPFGRLLFDRTDVGPALVSHLVAHPTLVRALPRAIQRDATRRSLTAGASLWLRPRLGDLVMSMGRHVAHAAERDGRASLRLDDGTTRSVDHVLLATGYRIDIARYAFLARELVAQVRCVEGHPILDDGFESSIPGLHFVGAPALYAFGPLLRFVSGTEFAARTVTRRATDARADRAVTKGAVGLQRATQ
jgi:cation diffusion facilitator CzcD-associated flavoprotein CzcO